MLDANYFLCSPSVESRILTRGFTIRERISLTRGFCQDNVICSHRLTANCSYLTTKIICLQFNLENNSVSLYLRILVRVLASTEQISNFKLITELTKILMSLDLYAAHFMIIYV